jgi:Protein kinase domain
MLAPGQTVDRYRLVAPVGAGGQGSVWRAEDPLAPGVPRAVKLLDLAGASRMAAERVRREARALHELDHASLVRCYAVFEDLPLHALGLVLDYVEGESLEAAARRRELDLSRRVMVLRHLANALAYVHARGMVHRDLKPANVLITSDFWRDAGDPRGVKLVDFGIATSASDAEGLTRTGHIVGTTGFLAPEQSDPRLGSPVATPASDVFALGVLAWLLLADKHPTGLALGSTVVDFASLYRAALDGARAWPPSGLPQELDRVFAPCLALHPAERPTAARVAEILGAASAAPATATQTASRPVVGAPSAKSGSGWRSVAVPGVLLLLVLLGGGAAAAEFWPRASTAPRHNSSASLPTPGVRGSAAPRAPSCGWEAYAEDCGRAPTCPLIFPPDEPLEIRFAYALPKIPSDARVCARTATGDQHCWPATTDFTPMPVLARDLGQRPLDIWIQTPNGSRIGERNMVRSDPRIGSETLWEGLEFGSVGAERVYFYVDPPGRERPLGIDLAKSCRKAK